MNQAVVAESERLVLRRWNDQDAEDLAVLGTTEVVRFLGGVPWDRNRTREAIALYREIEQSLGLTTWAVTLRADGRLVGSCGYARTNVAWLRQDLVVEIGWTLGRQWWGRGLATEAASAVLPLADEGIGRRRIVSKCALENTRSEAVMHRIGMRRVGVVRGIWASPTVICRFP